MNVSASDGDGTGALAGAAKQCRGGGRAIVESEQSSGAAKEGGGEGAAEEAEVFIERGYLKRIPTRRR